MIGTTVRNYRAWVGALCLCLWVMMAGCQGPEVPEHKPRIAAMETPTPSGPTFPKPQPPVYPPSTPSSRDLSGRTIVIDPGHGGKDPGAGKVGYSPKPEKVIVLKLARLVANELQEKNAHVVMTRDRDYFVELDERAEIAERNSADLFVAIHADSSRKSSVDGMTLYIAKAASQRTWSKAYRMQTVLENAGYNVNGIRRADYKVLILHNRPAVLIECGYLTNPADARRLNDDAYLAKMAQTIAQAIANAVAK